MKHHISDDIYYLLRPHSTCTVDEYFLDKLNGARLSRLREKARDQFHRESFEWVKNDRVDVAGWRRSMAERLEAEIDAYLKVWDGPDIRFRDFLFWVYEQVKGTLLRHLERIVNPEVRGESNIRAFENEAYPLQKMSWLRIEEEIRDLSRRPPSEPAISTPETVIKDGRPQQSWKFNKEKERIWLIGNSRFTELKGFYYIQELLSRPGEPIDCLELLKITEAGFRNFLPQVDSGDAADAQAIRQYKLRLQEQIPREREEAESKQDYQTIDRLDKEVEEITKHLNAARGLGGKRRRLGDLNNRLRDRVSAAIRRATKRIRKNEPEIGQHLEESIRLGYTPQYAPEGTSPDWSLT